MTRSMAAMLACLVFGAGGMWLASNFRVKFEPVGTPDQPPPPAPVAQVPVIPPAPPAEPAKLPAHLLAQAPPPTPADIRPANHTAVAVAAGVLGVGQSGAKVRVTEAAETLDTKDIYWDTASGQKVLAATNSLVLKLDPAPAPADLGVSLNGQPPTATPASAFKYDQGSKTLTLALGDSSWPTGSVKVGISAKAGGNFPLAPDATVEVVRAGSPSAGRLLVNSTLDSPYLKDSADVPAVASTAVNVYNGYLRVRGQTLANSGTVEFLTVLENEPTGKFPVPVPAAALKSLSATTGEWEYELNLGRYPSNTKGYLLCRTSAGGNHFYSSKLVPLNWLAKNAPAAPKLTAGRPLEELVASKNLLDKDSSTPDTPAYRSNKTAFTLKVPTPGDGQVLLLYVGDQTVPAQAKRTGITPVEFDPFPVNGSGDYLVSVAGVNGNSEVGPRAKFLLKVRTVGPRAISVSAPGFGTGAGRKETLAVQFQGEELDVDSAVLSSNYSLEHNEGNPKPKDAQGNLTVQGTTVRIIYGDIVPGTYTFKVKAKAGGAGSETGIRDVYGNFLVGPSGGTTEDAVFQLTALAAETQAASTSAGVTDATGKNAVFPEYTPFREIRDGPNPGDRVETRVVRLYYTRDAHRVAQIVNRDARSFNGPSVTVARRAADRVRDDADAAQLERQRLERDAVRAAVETRQAETELRQLEARLQTARTEKATTTLQLSQRQQQLDQFQRTLGRDQTNIGVRAGTDTSVDAASRRVAAAGADIERSKQALRALSLSEASSLLDVENTLNQPRADLGTSQKNYTNAIGIAQFEIGQKKADLAAADTALQNAQTALASAKPEDKPAAEQKRDSAITAKKNAEVEVLRVEKEQNALVAPKLEDFQAKQTAFQLAAQRADAARQSLATLPTQTAALAEAQRELERAQVVARGRAAIDTGADLSQDTVNGLREEIRKLQFAQSTAATAEQQLQASIAALQGRIQGLRATELAKTEAALGKDGEERLKRMEQFRREVAAALADPDTYAKGDPESKDPVLQCSVSVIGEGLIQIRGPVKGLNVIRTMINQIDAPTGQVRVGVHTVQVNGERVDRMNKVVENIQRYIDHSRFLTGTSAQMLRNAVTGVAARKATEAAQTLAPGCTQADRDQKYLYAFFGKDFIDELKALDSEFLRTGNKVLSLHSMDSTSLASALFLLSLARNDVREEILREFQGQLQVKLPQAEWDKFVSGLSCPSKCEACFDRTFCTLAQNAKFPTFFGFFNNEVMGPDTLTPVQREFVRLAQIFKARMVTEIELKQRVMERTLLEDRVGNFREEQREAKRKEDKANADLVRFRDSLARTASEAQKAVAEMEGIRAAIDGVVQDVLQGVKETANNLPLEKDPLTAPNNMMPRVGGKEINPKPFRIPQKVVDPQDSTRVTHVTFKNAPDTRQVLLNAMTFLDQFTFLGQGNQARLANLTRRVEKATGAGDQRLTNVEYHELRDDLISLLDIVRAQSADGKKTLSELERALRDKNVDVFAVVGKYNLLRDEVTQELKPSSELGERVRTLFLQQANPAFAALGKAGTDYAASRQIAALSRRPLDEKKLLDMLVDEMEEKLIELLDGTRAHTANVDNYLKALSSALDDDFMTQFYQPAFKKVRSLSAGWDVQLGQIETTTVLTNNRVLGKVSPTASMEFDLPRRDILLREAFKAAKASVQDYGALLNDPVFLSLVKAYSGGPVGAQYGGGGFGGLPAVRNVLPGLPGSADEMIMSQAGGKRPEFGTHLEGLIADPAIYKFETGTGYEIRPVISPDGQAVVFAFDYMYTTDVREPVRADEKHLGRVKRHLLHTDVQLSNYELREVSKYWVTLKAARTSKGVSLLQDIPVAGALFRPAPSAGSSLQQNLIYSQAAIFPTLFDLMGLRYAPAVADLDPDGLINDEFVARGRQEYLRAFIFDYGASRVDDALRILYGERRPDLYRAQRSIPHEHPNGYRGPGLRQRDAILREGYDPLDSYPESKFAPGMRLPQRDSRDPHGFDGVPVIPPGAIVPGHTGGGPGGFGKGSDPFDMPSTALGTTVGPVPAGVRNSPPLPTPRPLQALPPIPTVAPPASVTPRSQAPAEPPPAPRAVWREPLPLPAGQFFPQGRR